MNSGGHLVPVVAGSSDGTRGLGECARRAASSSRKDRHPGARLDAEPRDREGVRAKPHNSGSARKAHRRRLPAAHPCRETSAGRLRNELGGAWSAPWGRRTPPRAEHTCSAT
jgi:hypothetical protein